MRGLDGQSLGRASLLFAVVIRGEVLLVAETLLLAVAAEEEKGGEEHEGGKDETEDQQEQVDHVVGAVKAVVGIGREIDSGGLGAAG